MKPLYLTKLVVVAAILFTCNWGANAQTTFNYTGGVQTYSVPNGVTAIGVDLAGASGGNGECWSTNAGGGRVVCNLAVTGGQPLYIYVGQQGANYNSTSAYTTPAFNGGGSGYYYGGGGGGGTDIRTSASGTAYTNRLVVGGGGAGTGYYDCASYDAGGAGGYPAGANGTYYGTGSYYNYYNGTGGSQSGGGIASLDGGSAGGFGVGGNQAAYYYGSGGGGGYYGGGGSYIEGAGGGSSYYSSACSAVTTTSGYRQGNGYVIICAPNVGSILGNVPVCAGSVLSLTGTGSGGVWSSGTPSIATVDGSGNVTGVSGGLATITYAVTVSGCGAGFVTATVTVNPAPTAIIGAGNVCVGSTTTLSDAGGGTWSSSIAADASISSTGVVTGLVVGTPTITYTLPVTGCTVTTPMVVNPLPAYISGANNVCAAGANITLSDASSGGSWTSSNTGTATITAGSGIVTGGAAGTVNITYTLPTGCKISTPITVNPLPSLITGSTHVCVASTTTLSDAGGGSWSSNNTSIASVGPTGVVSGVTAGSATITYTLPTGCSITNSMLVNPLPNAITGTAVVCQGATTSFSDISSGGSWSISNPALATIVPSSGAVSTILSGTPIVTYTLPTGCAITTPLTINALPTPFNVTGGGNYCAGTGGLHVGLSLSTTGVTYKLYNGSTLMATVGGSNSALDFGIFTANGTYTANAISVAAGCTNSMAGSTTIFTNPLPNTYNVTGGGSYCPGGSGAHVYQSGSDAGINYQLSVGGSPTGAAISGTGSSLDFGLQTTPGTYTITATNPVTGCSVSMVGSALVSINALPPLHNVSAGGSYCAGGAGVTITLDGSDPSTTYQLFYGSLSIGSVMTGTGGALNFGLQTGAGTYTIAASSTTTGCSTNMNGSAAITINPLPHVYFVTGGGSYCPGGPGVHVNLNYSNAGVNYQLYLGSSVVGSLVPGSGTGLDLGLQTVAGTYSVIGIDASTGCTTNMSGSATVNINSLPVLHNVTGGGNFCTGGVGVHIGLNGSTSGATYQLMYGGSSLGLPVTGTGGSLNFGLQTAAGSYTVVATNISTSCTANMTGSATVSVSPLPNVDTVIGAGTTYCAGGTGIDIMLNGSDVSVNYQLYRGGAAAGTAAAGTGGPVDFGSHMLAGVYTVIGTNSTTGCSSSMYGNAAISISPAPAVYAITGGGSYCSGGTGVHINLSGSTLGVNYQLSDTSGSVATLAGSGSALDFGLQTVGGSYTVVATDAISGCMSTMAGSPSVNINALPMAYTVTGSGNYCMGGTGTPVYLSGSDYGMHYRLYNGSVAVGSYVTGTGPMIDFGAQTTGTYTVIATNPSTGCSNNMNSSAVIGINPLPVAQTVMGGGPYCAGGTGSDVALGNSSAGVNYTLVYSGTPSGLIMAGTGAALDFGSQTGAGTYTVVAQDTTTMCSGNMAGSAVVTITPQPAVETITGGGAYCAGGSGEAVHMSGSNSGIRYQLLNGALAVGGLVTGTGGSINFGLETAAGTYTVIASPGGLCQTTMSGSAMITVSPLPTTYTVMGGGAYCATGTGVDVSLSGSQAGIDYKLNKGTTIIGTFPGTGSALDFGSETTGGLYTVVATDTTTGCTSAMTGSGSVSVLPAPHVFDMGGGGPYCAGGNGTDVILNGSNTDVFYQLMQGGVATGVPMAGTGTILDFGLQTVAGAYTVVASDAATSCTNNMADTAHVSIDPIVTPSMSALTSSGGLTIKMGQSNTITATVTNGGADGPAYQWYVNSFLIAGATNATYTSTQFANNDTVACIATSTGMCGGQTVKKSLVLTVLNTTFVNMVVTGNSDVRVMPNPNNGIFSITGSIGTSSDEEVSLEVVDMVGHVVYIGKTIATNGTINDRIQLNGVANGMYLLNLRSNSVSQVFHIVVEQ